MSQDFKNSPDYAEFQKEWSKTKKRYANWLGHPDDHEPTEKVTPENINP